MYMNVYFNSYNNNYGIIVFVFIKIKLGFMIIIDIIFLF